MFAVLPTTCPYELVHVYDIGPLPLTPRPVMEPVLPPQTLVFVVGVAVSVGTVFTVMTIDAVFEQLLPFVPLTE